MVSKKASHRPPPGAGLDAKPRNKIQRQLLHIKRKRAKDSSRRAERYAFKKEEAKNPKLKEERLKRNIPLTIDRKRVWDDAGSDVEDAAKFPSLFSTENPKSPKILITTSLNSSLHHEAELLTDLFPNSVYVRRTRHRFAHQFSIREISKFATNRNFTAVVILREDQKKPAGLDIVHLPTGPMFHFSMTNWVEGKRIPGHGRATEHWPELILNNFRTPLGLLTAHLFRTLFPPQPDIEGRQVVTVLNSRDYLFFRRHRYVFREKRETEKAVVGSDGKEMKGAEGIRAGMQELGPRFTLKLRRVDKGIQRASGQEWEWKGQMEKTRTKFQL
ncbi:Brix-domain-containing protein [Aspergillus phoenicis ATCC 13157]|uniref:Brix-domain-containing protein n=1 Tax=Aspergillus phoenicis ATCC 13157 TaxID=1353007 RepID=A0A370PD46_ASPPH|nr:Brix-domain-containing protein [Aspergillus phoenicis ATCC 13157]